MHPGSMDSSAELDNVTMYVWARTGEDEWAVGITVMEWFTYLGEIRLWREY